MQLLKHCPSIHNFTDERDITTNALKGFNSVVVVVGYRKRYTNIICKLSIFPLLPQFPTHIANFIVKCNWFKEPIYFWPIPEMDTSKHAMTQLKTAPLRILMSFYKLLHPLFQVTNHEQWNHKANFIDWGQFIGRPISVTNIHTEVTQA